MPCRHTWSLQRDGLTWLCLGGSPHPPNPESQPRAHRKARTKAAVRVGQDLGTGRRGGLGDLSSRGSGLLMALGWGRLLVHFQLLERV